MTWSSILRMAQEYLKWGVVLAIFLGMAFVVGYFVVYKRICGGKKRLRLWTVVLGAVFLCYLVVACGATLGRGGNWNGAELAPFSSYRNAWYAFSVTEWRNLILNILLFVPFGFLLPCLSVSCRKPWKTYLAGAGFSLLIETAQLAFHRGIFEMDDILNNFLGAVIGYGLYRLLCFLLQIRRKERERFVRVLLFQLPFGLAAVGFCMIFLVYHSQELGNLGRAFHAKTSMKGVEVRLEAELSEERTEVWIYQCHTADRAETQKLAEDFFAGIGTQIDLSYSSYYQDTAIYCSVNREHDLWIDYVGCSVRFTDFSALWADGERAPGKEDAEREEIEASLTALGVYLPDGTEFENQGDGRYRFTAEQIPAGDVMYNGTLSCTYHADGKIVEMDNQVVAWQKYRKSRVKSEQEAYEELLAGKFLCELPGEKLTELVVRGVKLGYQRDSKGYCQPVYVFCVLCNQEEREIALPALFPSLFVVFVNEGLPGGSERLVAPYRADGFV